VPHLIGVPTEFDKATYYKNFFKTPLTVNNCTESLLGAPQSQTDDYAALLVLSQLMTFTYLLPAIREKGGAYGAGCSAGESGTFTFYSFRDPKIQQTFESFERSISHVLDKDFSEQQLREAKMLTFQKLDKVLEPSLKGLLAFSRGYTDEHRMKLRLRALDLTREDLVAVAEKYLIKAIENGRTSRVVFGSQQAPFDELQQQGWSVFNPIDFLSYKYFDQWNQETAAAEAHHL
jgi:Zn-dependent M16 (insulinase) family peptidase